MADAGLVAEMKALVNGEVRVIARITLTDKVTYLPVGSDDWTPCHLPDVIQHPQSGLWVDMLLEPNRYFDLLPWYYSGDYLWVQEVTDG